jgi:hypothetical protein
MLLRCLKSTKYWNLLSFCLLIIDYCEIRKRLQKKQIKFQILYFCPMKYGFFLLLTLCSHLLLPAQSFTRFDLKGWSLTIDKKGGLSKLEPDGRGHNLLRKEEASPLLSVMVGKTRILPKKARFNTVDSVFTLSYAKGIQVGVRVFKRPRHLTFEVVSVSPENAVEAVIWGPYQTSLNKSIGETVGIVQGTDYTIGLQALNTKTLGGYPWTDNDHLPQLDIFSQPDFDSLDTPKRFVLYSLEAAKPTRLGSTLQAYTRNRATERIIRNWGMDQYTAPAFADGGLAGSKIALFMCPNAETLDRIGEIEIAEGLPHPVINGVWVKKTPIINASYLIMDFTERNIDTCLDYTQKMGFQYLYHGHPFQTWGHFPLIKDQFPNGYAGMRQCAEKAAQRNLFLGTHMLSNFITTDDPYVTPVPDPRLAVVGSAVLAAPIGSTDPTIRIEGNPAFFQTATNNNLKSIRIGTEIIRYESVSQTAPWILNNCQRGQFGTRATAHQQGASVEKLSDHGYNVFLGNAALSREIAENMADFMNATQVRMLDFDGLEGNHTTGMGNYGEVLFADAWYRRLAPSIKNHYLLGASRSGHFFWHYYSRMNWGEPWYAGFRESQTEYRLRNQAYYKRNLMPGMLGWFKYTASTTVEDIQWLMARSAAYNAGFAFVANMAALQENGHTERILDIIRTWENARLKGLFTPEIQGRMLELSTEFSLQQNSPDTYLLTEFFSHKHNHIYRARQPGEPTYTSLKLENKHAAQPLRWLVTAQDTDLKNIVFTLAQYKTIQVPITLKKGETLRYDGGAEAVVYSKNWQVTSKILLRQEDWMLPAGSHTLQFDCRFEHPGENASAKAEFILVGPTEQLRL